MTVRTITALFCDFGACPCGRKAFFARAGASTDKVLRHLAGLQGWTYEVLEDTSPELDGHIMDMCPEANQTWDTIANQLRARGDLADE